MINFQWQHRYKWIDNKRFHAYIKYNLNDSVSNELLLRELLHIDIHLRWTAFAERPFSSINKLGEIELIGFFFK